jgi:hypothetical protein
MPRGRNTYRLAAALLNVLYPSACPVCSGPSDSLSHCPICSICWAAIRRHDGPSCRVCARPLASEHAGLCGDCLREPPPFSRVITYGPYSDVLKEALHLLKFSSVKRLSRPLGLLLAGLEMPEVDFIVPVPLSGRELRRRGFIQDPFQDHRHTPLPEAPPQKKGDPSPGLPPEKGKASQPQRGLRGQGKAQWREGPHSRRRGDHRGHRKGMLKGHH